MIMKVCMIGLGYIGFPTACVLGGAGHHVVGVDVDSDLVAKLRSGGLHIANEDGLASLAHEVIGSGRLRVSDTPEPADVFMIAVPTPFKISSSAPVGINNSELSEAELEVAASFEYPVADLGYVEEATRSIAPFVKKGDLIVLESTVTPGATTQVVCSTLDSVTELHAADDLLVVHAPERVLPGNIVHELVHNDRIVGGVTPEATRAGVAFYETFVLGDVIGTDATTAELVKLMENTFRDVNIALANEFAIICEKLGINVFEAIKLANRHPRVKFLSPGPGVGGHCIAIDPYFVMQAAPQESRLIRVARQINSDMPHHVVQLFERIVGEAKEVGDDVRTVTILGASYKANVGDERESPALEIAELISNKGYRVMIHDPFIERFSEIPLAEVVRSADVLILATDHEVYRKELSLEAFAKSTSTHRPIVLDTRGLFGHEWDDSGFVVRRLGVGE